jgi:uncharacterized membrane protein YfcA
LIALATFAGATLQASTGFGFALILAPAMFAAYDPSSAIFTLLLLSGCLNLLILSTEEREIDARVNDLFVVFTFALPGLAIGLVILEALSKPPLQIAVGICVVVGAGIQARRYRRRSLPRRPSTRLRVGTGLVCGMLTTTTGTNGPPMVLMLQRTGASPAELRDTMAGLLIGLDVVGIGALLIGGSELDLPDAGTLAVLVALTVAGHAVGRQIFERLRPERFQIAALLIVSAAGVASFAAGISG